MFKLKKGITEIIRFLNQGRSTLECFFDFLRKSTTMYYKGLQAYEAYDVIISIIQYINIFLQISSDRRAWRIRKILNDG